MGEKGTGMRNFKSMTDFHQSFTVFDFLPDNNLIAE